MYLDSCMLHCTTLTPHCLQVLITDTVAPWLAPVRWTFVASLLPKAFFG
jgi:hypothetical protein